MCHQRRACSVWLLLILILPGKVWGGLYNPCEIDEGPFLPEYYDQKLNHGFQITLLKYRSCGLDGALKDSPFRQRYLLVQNLDASDQARKLSALEKLALSEYLIRRRRALEAQRLLLPFSRQPDGNFLILSNLATACQQLGDYQQAIEHLGDALRLWPAHPENLTPAQKTMLENMHWTLEETYPRCRTAEEYFLKLLRSRQREARQGTKAGNVDPLFTDKDATPIRYVDDSGQFAVGKLAPAEKAKLPDGSIDKALGIVQQLLVWLPMDTRLYWQLGELYNARGKPRDVQAAQKIFIDLVENMGERAKEVLERRQVLKEHTIPPENDLSLPDDFVDKEPPKKAEDFKPIDWRTIGISFGFGAVVAFFAQWQLREIRRRRQHPGPTQGGQSAASS